MSSTARLHRFTPVYGEWPVCDLCGEREDAPIHATGVPQETHATSAVHVLPTKDLIEHEAKGDECVCGPEVEFVSGGEVITHHSLDGREEHEPDAR